MCGCARNHGVMHKEMVNVIRRNHGGCWFLVLSNMFKLLDYCFWSILYEQNG